MHFLSENKDTELVFGAFAASQEEMKQLETRVVEMIADQFQDHELEKEVDYQGAENPLEDNRHQSKRYSFVNMQDESELIKKLEFVRFDCRFEQSASPLYPDSGDQCWYPSNK